MIAQKNTADKLTMQKKKCPEVPTKKRMVQHKNGDLQQCLEMHSNILFLQGKSDIFTNVTFKKGYCDYHLISFVFYMQFLVLYNNRFLFCKQIHSNNNFK